MRIRGSKMTFFESFVFLLKRGNVKFSVTRTMEVYLLAHTREYDYLNTTQEKTKCSVGYCLSLLCTLFRQLITNLHDYLQF